MLKAQKVPGQNKYFISCRDYDNKQLFRSLEQFNTKAEAEDLIGKIKKGIRHPSSFELLPDMRISFSYDGEQIISAMKHFSRIFSAHTTTFCEMGKHAETIAMKECMS